MVQDNAIGENLKRLRQQARLSAREMGAILGVTHQQIYKYEKGRDQLSLRKLHILKCALGVPYEFFFEGLPSYPQQIFWRPAKNSDVN